MTDNPRTWYAERRRSADWIYGIGFAICLMAIASGACWVVGNFPL